MTAPARADVAPGPDATPGTAAPRPRVALNAFGIAFGLSGIAGTWTAATQSLGSPRAVSEVLWVIAAVAWVVTIFRYLVRAGGTDQVLGDFRHPVFGPFVALVPVVGSLLSAHLATVLPAVGEVGVWVMLALSTLFGAWFLAQLFTVPRDAKALHGGYLLPTVAASLLSAQALGVIGHASLGIVFFWAGIFFWVLIGSILLYRFATGPAIPPALLPTLAILSAPPAVAGNAWWAIDGGRPSPILTVLMGLMVALLVSQLFLIPRYARTGFAIGFWAMTFTGGASATFAVHVLTRTTPPGYAVWAWIAVGLATLLVATIAWRSVVLVLQARRARRANRRTTTERPGTAA